MGTMAGLIILFLKQLPYLSKTLEYVGRMWKKVYNAKSFYQTIYLNIKLDKKSFRLNKNFFVTLL